MATYFTLLVKLFLLSCLLSVLTHLYILHEVLLLSVQVSLPLLLIVLLLYTFFHGFFIRFLFGTQKCKFTINIYCFAQVSFTNVSNSPLCRFNRNHHLTFCAARRHCYGWLRCWLKDIFLYQLCSNCVTLGHLHNVHKYTHI